MTSHPGQVLRTAFWQEFGRPEERTQDAWWAQLATGAREAASAAYKHGGMSASIHAAACYLEHKFWEHPAHVAWKPRDQRDHEADLPRWRTIATSFLTTLQRQRTAA